MIIYEVNLIVDQDIAAVYLAWLREHVVEICRLPGFITSKIFIVKSEPSDNPALNLCVHYHIDTANNLQYYLQTHAVEMRNQAKIRFGDKFQATRRILEQT